MRNAVRWPRAVPIVIGALVALSSACNDGQRVDEDRCSGIGGDPFVPTSCVFVQGTVLGPDGAPVASANIAVDCFGSNVIGCQGTGQSNGAGRYRLLVVDLAEAGGPAQVVLRVWDRASDRRAESDSIHVTFQPPGELAAVYDIDIHLQDAPPG